MKTTKNNMTALIIGGGIGGLAAAVALRRVGITARVFERAPELREVGAGLSLWPNGMRALDQMGVGELVRGRAVRDIQSALRTSTGRVILATAGADLERLLGDVSLVIHRAELLSFLRSRLPPGSVVTGAACVKIDASESGVIASFEDGRTELGDLLIGADGLHSVVRTRLFGNQPPSYAGYTAWRGVVPFDHRRLLAGVSIGKGSQFGQVPMADGRVYWFATRNMGPRTTRPVEGWRPSLLRLFADWHQPIPALIEATAEADILHNDIVDRPPLRSWTVGRVTLLGDAAHPMTPNLGQGANQALEDASTLASALSGVPTADVPAALLAYEQKRLPRANTLVEQSRRVGRVMQLESRVTCWLRNALLGTQMAGRMQMSQLRQVVLPAR